MCICLKVYVVPQGCSSPIVVKFADTQKDKEQKRMAQQLQQQMQQLNAASMWGNLTGLNSLGPQYLAVSTAKHCSLSLVYGLVHTSVAMYLWTSNMNLSTRGREVQ